MATPFKVVDINPDLAKDLIEALKKKFSDFRVDWRISKSAHQTTIVAHGSSIHDWKDEVIRYAEGWRDAKEFVPC